MEFRKRILIISVVVSVILFIDGTIIIGNFLLRPVGKPQIVKNSSTTDLIDEQGVSQESPVNIALFGLDEEGVRSDVIILLNFNPEDGKLNILSIARDTRVKARGKFEKMNALIGMGKEELAIKGIEQLSGLKIDYYLTLNFTGFKKIIDTLDGVEINVPTDMDYDDPEQNLHIHLKKGDQILDGNKSEQFVRYRKGNKNGQGYTDGDIGRIRVQQEFIKSLIDQKIKLRYLSKLDDVYFILKKYMRTNIELSDINFYLKGIRKMKYENVENYTIPGEPASIDGIWYFICDKKKTRELIDTKFFK
jgi:polyisoprenyl-teichoic acid--peptidoglycan teichoic acid transferase